MIPRARDKVESSPITLSTCRTVVRCSMRATSFSGAFSVTVARWRPRARERSICGEVSPGVTNAGRRAMSVAVRIAGDFQHPGGHLENPADRGPRTAGGAIRRFRAPARKIPQASEGFNT